MAEGNPGELRTPSPRLRQLETLKWNNTPSLLQSDHSFSSQLSGATVGQRIIFGERHQLWVSSSEYFLQVTRQPVIIRDIDRCHLIVIPSRYRTLVSISDYLQRRQIVSDTMLLPSMTVDPKTTKTPYSDATQVGNKLKVKGDRKFIQLWNIKGERIF